MSRQKIGHMSIVALLFAAVAACAPNSPREDDDARKCLTECTSRMGVVSAFGAMETAAFAHVAYANQIPFIAFRSLSDLAGAHDFTDVGAFFGSGLAESNEARVTLSFLDAWAKKTAKKDRN